MRRHVHPDDVATCAMCDHEWLPNEHPPADRYMLCPQCADEHLTTCLICECTIDPASIGGRNDRPMCDECRFDDKIIVHVGANVWEVIEPAHVSPLTIANVFERRGVCVYPTVDHLIAHEVARCAT